MIRNLASTFTGYAVWTVVFLTGNAVIRNALPDVHDESGMTRDGTALLLYLVVSFAASVAAGFGTGKMIVRPGMGWVLLLGFLLLGTGIPVQMGYWDQLPLWYHLVFLGALIPLTLVGGRLAGAGKGAE